MSISSDAFPSNEPLPTPPIDLAVAQAPVLADAQPHRWSPLTRIGFRFAFCYLTLYCLCNGNATVWGVAPLGGEWVAYMLSRSFLLPAQFLAGHLFHVAPPGNQIHATGSGDTALHWIAILLMLFVSLFATAIWSVLDRRRPHYQTLLASLRFLIRLTLGLGMVVYGIDKLFPLQMPEPSTSSLAEPFGMHSPMALLWNFIGLHPGYEMVCGAAELLGGVLLLLRRTALAGALFSAFVVSNVLLYNLFFDVPVKLFAGHLLLLCCFIILPDAVPLFRFFWLHQPAAPTGVWVPPSSRPWFRRATVITEIAFAVLALGKSIFYTSKYWSKTRMALTQPCPLCGAWSISPAPASAQSAPPPSTLFARPGRPGVELDVDSATFGTVRDASGASAFVTLHVDPAHGTLGFQFSDGRTALYGYSTPAPKLLTLTPTANSAAAPLSLALVHPPHSFPLQTRGFHWISEYPYQR